MGLHVVHFFQPINEKTAQGLVDVCLRAIQQEATEIQLRISSSGGSTGPAFTLCNFLKSLPVSVSAHNMGSVNSMAIPVYLASSHRTTEINSRFVVHPLTWTVGGGDIPHHSLRDWASQLDVDIEAYIRIFEKATEDANETFGIRAALTNPGDKIISPVDAVRTGIAHQQVSRPIPDTATSWWVNS